MEGNNIETLKREAEQCTKDMFLYSQFVNEQKILLFVEDENVLEEQKKLILHLWEEMEILNACVLSDWEDDNQPDEYTLKWGESYQEDAKKLIKQVTDVLNSICK